MLGSNVKEMVFALVPATAENRGGVGTHCKAHRVSKRLSPTQNLLHWERIAKELIRGVPKLDAVERDRRAHLYAVEDEQ